MSEAPIQGKRRCTCVGNEEVQFFYLFVFFSVVGRKKTVGKGALEDDFHVSTITLVKTNIPREHFWFEDEVSFQNGPLSGTW